MEQAPAPLKVFLVEDSPIVRERIETLLGSIAGARTVGHAEDADDAITAILAAHPDAVVLDLKLARGSGFDVLRALRRDAPEIDVYLLTNHAAEPYRRLAGKLGARGFFDKSTQFECVRDALAARAAK